MGILTYITWNCSPDILSIGPLTIKWYSLMFLITFVVGYCIMRYIFTAEQRDPQQVDTLAVYVFLGTLIGARLGHCLFYSPVHYLSNPVEIFKVWNGGLASHGGAIGILTALWLFAKKPQKRSSGKSKKTKSEITTNKLSFFWIVDRVVLVVALGGFFIRTGNFFNSEIIGIPSQAPWAIIFSSVDNVPRHPAMLYEAFAYLIFFFVLWFVYKNKVQNKNSYGLLFGLFLVLIFSARFVLEFIKEVQSSFEATLPIDMGQILSIPFIIGGIILLYFNIKGKFKHIDIAKK